MIRDVFAERIVDGAATSIILSTVDARESKPSELAGRMELT